MSALEEVPAEETEVEEPPGEVVDKRFGKAPEKPFTTEAAKEAVAEREKQKSRRKQTMSSRIREMVGHDPARLANLLFDIAENVSGSERSGDRIKATCELMDRGWGKAPTFMPVEGADPLGQSDLDQAIRDIADQLVARRAHPRLDAELIRREIDEGVRPEEGT